MTFSNLLTAYYSGREIIFDLDDTIYQETDFLFPAYKHIAQTHFEKQAKDVFDFLIRHFNESGRYNLFDKLLEKFPKAHLTTSHLTHTMRTCPLKKALIPYNWFDRFMAMVDDRFVLHIITNGNPVQQQLKLDSIKWPPQVNRTDFILANNYKPKPAPDSFFALKGFANFTSPIYVGDSESDQLFAKNLGIHFFDVKSLKGHEKTR